MRTGAAAIQVDKSQLSRETKQAMMSQFLGFGLDAYDMAMVLIMAPILVKIFASSKGSAAWQYITIVFTYSITMAARPVGAAIFGHFADKVGRKRLLILTIGGVGVMSFVAAFLPTYAQLGVWAYVLFCVLRFLMGCFFGGEYAVGHTFAIEHAPDGRRGANFVCRQGLHLLGYPRLGYGRGGDVAFNHDPIIAIIESQRTAGNLAAFGIKNAGRPASQHKFAVRPCIYKPFAGRPPVRLLDIHVPFRDNPVDLTRPRLRG